MSRTLEQRRAAFALAFIETIKEEDKEKFSTHIKKTPSLILQCGLGQALAFLLAEAGRDEQKPSKLLYKELQQWLCGTRDEVYPMRVYTSTELIHALVNGSRSDYFRAQEETLMLFNWLKKFAAAKL
jgi:CRISPR type III-B/RAMP module-associated protein Cmr5